MLLDKVHERLDILEGGEDGIRTPKVAGQRSKQSSARVSKAGAPDDSYGDRIHNVEINIEAIMNDMSTITQNKDKIQELLSKSESQLSKEEVAKLRHQVNESRSETTVLTHEVKIMEEKLDDVSEMKRRMDLLKGAPDATDFMNLRNRIDMMEKINSQLRKSMTDQEKKIKKIRESGTSVGQKSGNDTLEDVADKLAQLRIEFEDNRDNMKRVVEDHNR